MGDDPSKRHYYYPSYQPPTQSYYPPGAYPPPPGVYPPPYPGNPAPPPYAGSPPDAIAGAYQPFQQQHIQPTVVTSVYHQPSSMAISHAPSPYSVVSNVRAKIGSVVSEVSRSKLWKRVKGYSWVAATPSSCFHLEGRAVVAGHEPDHTPIWVGRANHNGDLLPCKVIPRNNVAYIAYAGQEIAKSDIDILCAEPGRVRWLPSSNGNPAAGALSGGHTASGETLYIGRTRYGGSLLPGKIHQSHGCMYVSYNGVEIPINSYECLVIV